jgi:hypothetical protein
MASTRLTPSASLRARYARVVGSIRTLAVCGSARNRRVTRLIEERDGEPLDPLPQDRPRDCSSVNLVGLARLAFPATGGAHQPRRDPHDPLAGGNQGLLEMVGEVAAILDRPHDLAVEPLRPAQRFQVPLLASRDLALVEESSCRGVDGRERVGLNPDAQTARSSITTKGSLMS